MLSPVNQHGNLGRWFELLPALFTLACPTAQDSHLTNMHASMHVRTYAHHNISATTTWGIPITILAGVS